MSSGEVNCHGFRRSCPYEIYVKSVRLLISDGLCLLAYDVKMAYAKATLVRLSGFALLFAKLFVWVLLFPGDTCLRNAPRELSARDTRSGDARYTVGVAFV